MKLKPLGRTGVQVSELCFGTMSFGGEADEAAAAAMYRACRDAGINFFDCADQYNKGEAERILGRRVAGHRDEVAIATKCFNPSGTDPNARGSSRRHVSRALEDAERAGRVPYPAASGGSASQTQHALDVQAAHGWARLEVVQPMYTLVKRQAEVEILPMAEANGLAATPYGAVASLLSGKYAGAEAQGRIGARNVEQLRALLDAVNVAMTPQLRAEIAALLRTPPPATDRLEEQRKKAA